MLINSQQYAENMEALRNQAEREHEEAQNRLAEVERRLARAEKERDAMMRVLLVVAEDMKSVVEQSYTHAQRNGILLHLSAKIDLHCRRWKWTSYNEIKPDVDDIPF